MKEKLTKEIIDTRIFTIEKILIDLNKRWISVKAQIEIMENYKRELFEERKKIEGEKT